MTGGQLVGVGLVGVGALYLFGRWQLAQAGGEGDPYGNPFGILPPVDPTAPVRRTQSAGEPSFRAPATGGSPGGSFGTAALNAGVAVGTGAATAGVVGSSIALGAATAGVGAGIALLSWAIVKKGLFRGGEVGVYTNPMRDNFLLQFGPGGWDMTPGQDGWPTSGAPKLAAMLSAITGEPDGSHYFKALMGAESVQNELIPATRAIKGVLAGQGIYIDSF